MNDWRLLALDMDGTLLSSDGTVSMENRKWIYLARDAGIDVTLATGRLMRGLVPDVAQDLQVTAPIVTANGGQVAMPAGEILSRHALTPADVAWMHGLAVQHGVHFWAAAVEDNYGPDTFPDELLDKTWLKFGMAAQDADVIQEIWAIIERTGKYELTNSDPKNVEVNPRGVTKASGLQTACDRLGIGANQVIAIGDSLNDVPMLRWAGLGIAMGNAQPVVKAAAQRLTATNDENGVAKAIAAVLNERATGA